MKKGEWKAIAHEAEQARSEAERQVSISAADVRQLAAELEVIRKNWRPVPITHPWQPRNPQCALCDEPRDSMRHDTPERGDLTK
jgi:hypothetical protein